MVGLIQNVGESFKFGFGQCYHDGIKGFLRMLALVVLNIIPIARFISDGIFLKVFKGEKPDFTHAGQSFIRGLLFFVVAILYFLIPAILLTIGTVLSGVSLGMFAVTNVAAVVTGGQV